MYTVLQLQLFWAYTEEDAQQVKQIQEHYLKLIRTLYIGLQNTIKFEQGICILNMLIKIWVIFLNIH